MARPRLGEHPLTKTERQRRWRAKQRLEQSASGSAGPVRFIQPAATGSMPEWYHARLAEVTGERDELRQQLDQLRRNLVALGEVCFGCGKRGHQVGVMFGSSRGSVRMRVCDACLVRLNEKLQDIRQAQPAMDNR